MSHYKWWREKPSFWYKIRIKLGFVTNKEIETAIKHEWARMEKRLDSGG